MKKPIWPHLRFERKVRRIEQRNGCWIWTGARTGDGHPKMLFGSRRDGTRRLESAVRFSYRFHNGPINAGEIVTPRCRNKACVNPHHLEIMSRSGLVCRLVRQKRWQAQIDSIVRRNKISPLCLSGEKNPHARLTSDQVRAIRAALEVGAQPKNLARAYGVSMSHVSAIKHRKTWRHL